MEREKTVNERLAEAIGVLNKAERALREKVDDSQAYVERARVVYVRFQQQAVVAEQESLEKLDKIKTRRIQLGSLFGKSKEEIVSGDVNLEELMEPIGKGVCEYKFQ
jgi:RNA binding exosome subunit